MGAMLPEFQSLSGFPMSCNDIVRAEGAKETIVSIPIGFSNELQLPHRLTVGGSLAIVSIPIGFSNELQRNSSELFENSRNLFQSLSGFPMSCNAVIPYAAHPIGTVSIPIGFSNELQRS